MRRLPSLGAHDLVTCLDDAINYLADQDDLRAAFDGVARSLAPGGVFVFDANTLGVYRTLFARDTCFEHDGCFFALRGQASAELGAGEPAPLTIEAFKRMPDGTWSRVTSRHRQHHHDDATIRAALDEAGLGCSAVLGQTPDGELHPTPSELSHTKRIYVASLQSPITRKEEADAPHREARHADRPGSRVHQGQLADRCQAPATTTPGPAVTSR
jgi:SAM-dependent methyltransferase